MSATPDRTTIKATVGEFISKLRANLVADPPTAAQPFRRIEVAGEGVADYPRPFLALTLTKVRPIGVVDNDKLFEVSIALRAVLDVSATDPHDTMLDAIAAIEDYMDTILETGVIEGAEGFDNQIWTLDYPRATAGARVASASATQNIVVKVERQNNREPAS